MKKGVTLISILATVAIIGILTTTVTLSAFKVSNDSKKLKFATEISYITEAINSYYTANQSFPVGESITVDLTQISEKSISQFSDEEGYNERSIILYQIDKTKLGISDTIYGEGDTTNKDIYAFSKETQNVYYINGVSVSNVTYYTLTEDLRKLVGYNLSTNISKEPVTLKSTSDETSSSSTFLGIGVRSEITKVIFEENTINAPSNFIDVSETLDKSIIAWLEGTEVHIASDGEIFANSNSSYMFANIPKLTEIKNLKLLNTSKVTDMSWMFKSCSLLTDLNVEKFDTINVTNMYGMFYGCTNLKTIDVSGFNTSKVKHTGEMFHMCRNLTSLELTNFDVSHVINMASMFGACSSLTVLDLSSFDTTKIYNSSNLFYSCKKLKTIYTTDKLNVEKATYNDGMFKGCTALVGGNGTTFDSNYVDQLYARIDKSGTPGYFTEKTNIVISDKKSLVSNDEQEKYFFVTVNISDNNTVKSIKFEREVIKEEDALVYFKNNGIELQEDIIEVREDTKGITLCVEYNSGNTAIVSKVF